MQPFAYRQLGPLLVRALSHLLPPQPAFLLLGVLSLLVLATLVAAGLRRLRLAWWLPPAIFGLFFWSHQFNSLVLPDLLYAALLAILLTLLQHRRFTAAALLFLPLALARESTLLTLACFLLAGRQHLPRRALALAALSAVAGFTLVHLLTRTALPNNEQISPLFYIVAKLPWNLLRNLLGVDLWANVYPSCGVPRWQLPVHLGPLTAVGACGWEPGYPLQAFATLFSAFGLLPLLAFVALRREPPDILRRLSREPALRFALLYGVASFLVAPLLGNLFLRLIEYSWPLFFLFIPALLAASHLSLSTPRALLFLALHIALSWTNCGLPPRWMMTAALVAYPLGWLLLRSRRQPAAI